MMTLFASLKSLLAKPDVTQWHKWTMTPTKRAINGEFVSVEIWRRKVGAKWEYREVIANYPTGT